MMFVEIGQYREGRVQLLLRVWEDGRAEGQPWLVRQVAACRRPDPVTGEIAMRGPGLVRRVAACFGTAYTVSRVSVADVRRLPEQPLRRRRR
jgi:hypothetical protein